MREKTIKIWQEKTDWIAKNGGMVLVNVHPDYINFNNNLTNINEEFSINIYKDFLNYIISNYNNQFWNGIIRDLVNHF
jgi:hypothetical protein